MDRRSSWGSRACQRRRHGPGFSARGLRCQAKRDTASVRSKQPDADQLIEANPGGVSRLRPVELLERPRYSLQTNDFATGDRRRLYWCGAEVWGGALKALESARELVLGRDPFEIEYFRPQPLASEGVLATGKLGVVCCPRDRLPGPDRESNQSAGSGSDRRTFPRRGFFLRLQLFRHAYLRRAGSHHTRSAGPGVS